MHISAHIPWAAVSDRAPYFGTSHRGGVGTIRERCPIALTDRVVCCTVTNFKRGLRVLQRARAAPPQPMGTVWCPSWIRTWDICRSVGAYPVGSRRGPAMRPPRGEFAVIAGCMFGGIYPWKFSNFDHMYLGLYELRDDHMLHIIKTLSLSYRDLCFISVVALKEQEKIFERCDVANRVATRSQCVLVSHFAAR